MFGELLGQKPLFPGKSEIDQINKIFKELGAFNFVLNVHSFHLCQLSFLILASGFIGHATQQVLR